MVGKGFFFCEIIQQITRVPHTQEYGRIEIHLSRRGILLDISVTKIEWPIRLLKL